MDTVFLIRMAVRSYIFVFVDGLLSKVIKYFTHNNILFTLQNLIFSTLMLSDFVITN